MNMEKYEILKFVDNNFELDVRADKENDTVWLTQREMALLFDVSTDNIGLHIKNIISSYDKRDEYPKVKHYDSFTAIIPRVTDSYRERHKTDNFFFDNSSNTYYIIELKSGGDLDNKKAKSEKSELLKEYFMMKNQIALSKNINRKVKIFFATAYNRYGEGREWKQERVLQYFSREEFRHIFSCLSRRAKNTREHPFQPIRYGDNKVWWDLHQRRPVVRSRHKRRL